MIIKVCGMRDADNIRQLDDANIADWMGFIFFRKSSRNVEAIPQYMPKNSKKVGVFVNEPIESIADKVKSFGFNLVQLHGNESVDYVNQLKKLLPQDVQIIKMFQIASPEDLIPCADYEAQVDYFLFETRCESYGGSGKQFDWTLLHSYKGNTPFLITGGIGSEDADKVKAFSHPQCVGIDLNSRFEVAPALKDINKLKNFINIIR